MSVPTFSWVRALEEGVLTDMQLETLQATIDNGDADTHRSCTPAGLRSNAHRR